MTAVIEKKIGLAQAGLAAVFNADPSNRSVYPVPLSSHAGHSDCLSKIQFVQRHLGQQMGRNG